jgi:hypothetical protein
MKLHVWALAALASGLTSISLANAIESGPVADARSPVAHPTQRFHVNVPQVPLGAMALMATDVALVRFESSRAVFPESGVASTVYSATQLSSLKGVQRSQLEIHVGGARNAETWVVVEGAPSFAPGEEALVFLWADPADGVHGVLGLARGVYRVSRTEDGRRLVTGDHAQGMEIDAFLDRTAEAWIEALQVAEGKGK